ncbi:MAG: hypothetical protein DIU80_005080 [Chloroflexota bacterium]|nr:MAG: hypothetical protein DIU80_18995 [Chloroflexota bacterium]
MDAKALAKRYRSLWVGEAVAAVLFTAYLLNGALRDSDWTNWIARTYSLAVVVGILFQGVIWWRWKLRVLRAGERIMPAHVLAQFQRLKQLNWALIALFPAVLLVKWWLTSALWTGDTLYGLLILGGAVLEQINYYYYQLMYDNRYDWRYLLTRRRLRPGTVAKALALASSQHAPETPATAGS